jgi:hypothetical protein
MVRGKGRRDGLKPKKREAPWHTKFVQSSKLIIARRFPEARSSIKSVDISVWSADIYGRTEKQ